jgi:hypothetical protein
MQRARWFSPSEVAGGYRQDTNRHAFTVSGRIDADAVDHASAADRTTHNSTGGAVAGNQSGAQRLTRRPDPERPFDRALRAGYCGL